MTMPKKGSRHITVDGKKYRWMCREARENPNVYSDISLVVEEDVDQPGRPLLATVKNVETLDNRIVARVIQAAHDGGWDPSAKKANYKFTYQLTEPSLLAELRELAEG